VLIPTAGVVYNTRMKFNTAICAAAVCGCASFAAVADEAAKSETDEPSKAELAEEEKGEEEEVAFVSVETSVRVDSRYITYGLVSGKDPIVRLNGYATFFDWWYIGAEMLSDVTKGNGKRGGYGNHAGKLMTLDAQTGLAHEFDLGETLGTLGVDFYFTYEWIPRHHGIMYDTDYLDIEFMLNDLWFEPRLWIERDLMLDEGTYVNLAVGHTFELVGMRGVRLPEGKGEDAELTFKPSFAQGFGNTLRTRGYGLADDHGGVMDSTIKGEFVWTLCENVKVKAYVAYSDYWFDRTLRHGSRDHNGAWGSSCNHSWNFYGGVGVTVSF